MKSFLAATVLALGLAGCATAPDLLAEADAARPVTCSGHDDCEVKWSRALRWTLDTVAYRPQIQSDQMISTMGPLPNDPRPAVTITKVAQGGGTYSFEFRAGCDNLFGCIPSLAAVKASFVRAVMGPAGEPAPPPAAVGTRL